MRQRTTSTKFTQRTSAYAARSRADSIHWLFRTNIPRKPNQSFGSNIHKRNFFGMGEIIGVLTNVSTRRFLTSSVHTYRTIASIVSQRKQFALSPNQNNSSKMLVDKSEKAARNPRSARNILSRNYLVFFLDLPKCGLSNGSWKINQASPFYLAQALSARFVCQLTVYYPWADQPVDCTLTGSSNSREIPSLALWSSYPRIFWSS